MMFLHEQDLSGNIDFNVNEFRASEDFEFGEFITMHPPGSLDSGERVGHTSVGYAKGWWGIIDENRTGYGYLDQLYHLPTGLCIGYFPNAEGAKYMAEKLDLALDEHGLFQKGIFHLMAYAIRHAGMTFQFDHKESYRERDLKNDISRITQDLKMLDQSVFLRSFTELNHDLFSGDQP